MNKTIAILIGLQTVFLWSAVNHLFAAADQSAVVSGIMHDVTELGDILQKKHAIFEPSTISTNITTAIIKAVDPYGEVLTKEQAERRGEELRGVFYGVGLKITIKDKLPTIMDVVKEGAAEAEGLKAGDIIEKIGEQKTEGMSLEEVVSRLRGAKDETVLLTIRASEKKSETRECRLKRTFVQMPVTGVTEDWPHQIRYLKVNGLYENSGVQVVTQLVSWAETNCAGIILDLRDANGSDLQSAADVAGLFQPAGTVILNVRDGDGSVLTTYQGKADKSINAPVMVLINQTTCGAAEALAAALGACQGILLIGMPTRGDDSVREFLPLADGRIIYLATRRIEIKNEASYHGTGVNPHISVTQTNEPAKTEEIAGDEENGPFTKLSEEEKLNRALLRRTKGDAVLQRATDILLGLKALNIKGR
ncbi:MAG: S41 family peptidase [Kiritimatiellia bacterium]|nr:S41 family peptidase [Kiritimatiellia bacterium]